MTEEQNFEVKEEKCNCICHSKEFKKFLVIALGSFVGVFCALSLFAALHRPPAPMPYRGGHEMRPPIYRHCHCDRHMPPRGEFRPPVEHRAPINPEKNMKK